jgi:uncharacterized membrane protein YeaQ/YmgE (transglycosylase-associated protein family)
LSVLAWKHAVARGGEGIVSILAWIVVGLIAGILAKIAMPGFNLSSILVATLGSIILLALYRLVTRQAA